MDTRQEGLCAACTRSQQPFGNNRAAAGMVVTTGGANRTMRLDEDTSRDGRTMIAAAHAEDGGSKGVGGNQADNSIMDSGAVYVFGF